MAVAVYLLVEKNQNIPALLNENKKLITMESEKPPSRNNETSQKEIANKKGRNFPAEVNKARTSNVQMKTQKSALVKKEVKINKEYELYKSNQYCSAHFEYDSEEKIVSYLIDEANRDPNLTEERLIQTKRFMRERLYKCIKIVGDKTEVQFEKDTFDLLKESADSGYEKAQVAIALSYGDMSKLERYTAEESDYFYKNSLDYLNKASNQGDPDAKIYLVLMYLDPIYHPENFDVEKAKEMLKAAMKISRLKYTNVWIRVNEYDRRG